MRHIKKRGPLLIEVHAAFMIIRLFQHTTYPTKTSPMIAKHLFIFQDSNNADNEVTDGAKGLLKKYGPQSYSKTTLWTNGEKINTNGCVDTKANENAGKNFPNRVGVYLITHMNNPFYIAGADGVANMICDYLNSRKDLEIDCTMLDKLVIVTCVGADGLKTRFHDKDIITKISGKLKKENMDSQKHFEKKYKEASEKWDIERQKTLHESVGKYEKDSDKFFERDEKGNQKDNTMVMLACALDKRGVHPKIAAWDDSLYVRADGMKSTSHVLGRPVDPHERLLNKMMIQFTRIKDGLGSIRQLQREEWTDKTLLSKSFPSQSLSSQSKSET
jgi:hypothetical protein